MKLLAALALLSTTNAGISPKTKIGYSTGGDTSLPMGINPTGTVSVDLPLDDLPISVRLNGEYEMSENEMAPKELTVDIDAGSVGPVDVSGVLTIGDPLGARELTGEATLAHEYGTVTFDSTEAMPKEVTIRALSKAGVEVRPSWNPRIGAPEGFRSCVGWPAARRVALGRGNGGGVFGTCHCLALTPWSFITEGLPFLG